MEKDKSLIQTNSSIRRVEKQLYLGEKVINSHIALQFNEAFYLLNSKDILKSSQNFYFELLKNEDGFLENDFKYEVKIKSDYLKAIEIFDDLILQSPNLKIVYFFRGIAYKNIYKMDKSIADFSKVIEMDKNCKYAFKERGILFCKNFEYELAIDDFNSAINLDPNNSEFYHERAFVKSYISQEKALLDYNKSLELDPNNIIAYNNRGHALQRLFRERESRNDFMKVIDLSSEKIKSDADNKKLYYYRGWVKMALELYSESLIDLNKAIKLDANYLNAIFCKAYVKSLQNDFLESIRIFEKYIQIDSLDCNVYGHLGWVYERMELNEDAIKNYTLAIELNPNYKFPYLRRSELRKIGNDLKGSNEDYKKYLEVNNKQTKILNNEKLA